MCINTSYISILFMQDCDTAGKEVASDAGGYTPHQSTVQLAVSQGENRTSVRRGTTPKRVRASDASASVSLNAEILLFKSN
jgi:hypothetical protein